jgi:REP element-mobilizing transposase RayT
MPNHMHGQIILEKPYDSEDNRGFIASLGAYSKDLAKSNLGGFSGSKNPMLNENISRIIRWYKGRCSYEIKKINPHFKWQTRFYDHIIRNEAEYQRISDYINDNPRNWKEDRLYSGR